MGVKGARMRRVILLVAIAAASGNQATSSLLPGPGSHPAQPEGDDDHEMPE